MDSLNKKKSRLFRNHPPRLASQSFFYFLVFFLGITFCAVPIVAEKKDHWENKKRWAGKHRKGRDHWDYLKKEIGLSGNQLKKMELQKIDFEKSRENHRHRLKMIHLEIKTDVIGGNLDKKNLSARVKKIKSLHSKMLDTKFANIEKTITFLTLDQIQKLGEKHMLEVLLGLEHPGKRHGRRGWGKKKKK